MHSKKNILSTKALPENLITNSMEGFTIDCIPFIEITPFDKQEIENKIPVSNHLIQQAIFTSKNAVHAVKDLPFFKSIQCIYTLSGDSTQHVIKAFAQPDVKIYTTSSGSKLADIIIEQQPNTSIYFFCGEIRLDVLPNKLMDAGIRLIEIPVYQTKLTPQIITKQYDGILFFSPSAVESFFSVNSIPSHTVVCTIGDTTAASIKRCCNNQSIISSSPNAKILLEEAIQFLRNTDTTKS